MAYKDPNDRNRYYREYHRKYPERRLAAHRRWKAKNPDYFKNYNREYNKKHRKSLSEKHTQYLRNNPDAAERQREGVRKWRKDNPIKSRAYVAARKARKRGNAISDLNGIAAFTRRVRRRKSIPCYYCNTKIPGRIAHIDHLVALALGGPHAIHNLCVACPKCNLQKRSKPLSSVTANNQQFLPL